MKVALVTGASGGIGEQIARDLLAYGYYVAVTGRSLERLSAVWGNEAVLLIEADATSVEDCKKSVATVFEKLGQLDVLINNVGGGALQQTLEAGSEAEFNRMMDLNIKSVFFMTQCAIPHLASTHGSIVNFSSVLASRPGAGLASYCASKAAVEMLTKCSALELASKGIRVNCVAPTATETHFHQSAGMTAEAAAAYYKKAATAHPLGKLSTVKDVSEATLFLCDSARAGSITGAILTVDNGRLLTSATPKIE